MTFDKAAYLTEISDALIDILKGIHRGEKSIDNILDWLAEREDLDCIEYYTKFEEDNMTVSSIMLEVSTKVGPLQIDVPNIG